MYDLETGFYYLQSRYYDPETGRFISADSYVSTGTGSLGCNMFAYCNNDPVNYVDPTGEIIWEIVCLVSIIAGASILAVSNGISDITEEDLPDAGPVFEGELSDDAAYKAFYFDPKISTLNGETTKLELLAGVYNETHPIYDTVLEIDVAQAKANIGYFSLGVGIYLGEISISQEFDLFGKHLYLEYGVNYGIGAEVSIGKKGCISATHGLGGFISWRVTD